MIKLTDEQLKIRLPQLVQHERRVMAAVLEHIAEVDRRKLFFEWNHASLFDYLTIELRYSESAANRRMSAARALQKNPEILEEVKSGNLNLSQITMAQASIRLEEKAIGQRIDVEQRKVIFDSLKNLNRAQTQMVLDEKLPTHEPIVPVFEKHKRDESVEVTLRIPKELYAKLKEVKNLYSHIAPGAGWLALLDLMANDVKQKRDPRVRALKTLRRTA